MQIYDLLLWVAAFVAVLFTALVFFTSKGDAMSGGGNIRTTFKGRATIDDKIAQMTFSLAGAFVLLMLLLEFTAPK